MPRKLPARAWVGCRFGTTAHPRPPACFMRRHRGAHTDTPLRAVAASAAAAVAVARGAATRIPVLRPARMRRAPGAGAAAAARRRRFPRRRSGHPQTVAAVAAVRGDGGSRALRSRRRSSTTVAKRRWRRRCRTCGGGPGRSVTPAAAVAASATARGGGSGPPRGRITSCRGTWSKTTGTGRGTEAVLRAATLAETGAGGHVIATAIMLES